MNDADRELFRCCWQWRNDSLFTREILYGLMWEERRRRMKLFRRLGNDLRSVILRVA